MRIRKLEIRCRHKMPTNPGKYKPPAVQAALEAGRNGVRVSAYIGWRVGVLIWPYREPTPHVPDAKESARIIERAKRALAGDILEFERLRGVLKLPDTHFGDARVRTLCEALTTLNVDAVTAIREWTKA